MIQYPDTPGYFHPRSHEGSDFSPPAVNVLLSNFNPRSHEGSDIYSPDWGSYPT